MAEWNTSYNTRINIHNKLRSRLHCDVDLRREISADLKSESEYIEPNRIKIHTLEKINTPLLLQSIYCIYTGTLLSLAVIPAGQGSHFANCAGYYDHMSIDEYDSLILLYY
jgi:hypothetical protein